jgi:hypothetical protein
VQGPKLLQGLADQVALEGVHLAGAEAELSAQAKRWTFSISRTVTTG